MNRPLKKQERIEKQKIMPNIFYLNIKKDELLRVILKKENQERRDSKSPKLPKTVVTAFLST